jgi:hypothetical protein
MPDLPQFPGGERTMFPLPWPQLLMGLPSTRLRGNIYEVPVQVLGASEIGPYDELLAFVGTTTIYQLPVNVHHIVNGEHLPGTGWDYRKAPCIVLGEGLHRQYHGRFNEVLPDHHARLEVGSIDTQEKLALYYDMFVDQTQWMELWTIAARIITGSIDVPDPVTFQIQ